MAAPSSAAPLKVPSSGSGEPSTPSKSKSSAPANGATVPDISSPHELTAFVETLLEQLDTRFEEMSNEILDRMNQMSTRVDALEASIHDIINSDTPSVPPSPSQLPQPRSPSVPPSIRRSDTAASVP
ncbi:heat shock factor binding protein 1-domain-containing protein [Schizophyllum amplum]|uniref:Heat shock factor binding protein 1-domain-containing protein n=1 Tax=Schizophyllum amplum TaxID=97359 RepID=A0A550CV53_9AGAR|nr:heat shock factor binding protein 1-domain-containing protein [Auriculariopsis ampla]